MISDGTVTAVEDGYVLRFEFMVEAPPSEVWECLTSPEKMGWLGNGVIEPRVGGKVSFETVGGGTRIESQVLVFDPPHDLEYEWITEDGNGGPVHWTLTPAEEGFTKVLFTHHMPLEEFEKWRDMVLAGWHTLFEGLQKAARGEAAPWSKENWEKHHENYKQQNA